MVRIFFRLFIFVLILSALSPHRADADAFSNVPPSIPPDQSTIQILNGRQSVVGCGSVSVTCNTGAINASGAVNTSSASAYQLSGATILNTLANTGSPILSPETQNTPLTGALYMGYPLVKGYAASWAATSGNGIYSEMDTVNLTMPTTATVHWGMRETTINVLSGTLNAELNTQKMFTQINSGATVQNGEQLELELSLASGATLTNNWAGVIINPTLASGATSTGASLYGVEWAPTFNATGALALAAGYQCGVHSGSGSLPSQNYCVYNLDSGEDIFNKGHYVSRTGNSPSVGGGGTSCGSGTLDSQASDQAGVITLGSTASTSCNIGFGTTWRHAPYCTATPIGGGTTPTSYTISTVGLTFNYSSQSSQAYQYFCWGNG